MNTIKGLSDRAFLLILDGFGINPKSPKNAIQDAKTPHLDQLFSDYPMTTIEPGGEAVGLPAGVVGNSEVGHLNIGAGRPVRQDLVRINESIANQTFATLPRMRQLIENCASKRIHLMGLLSDGGVHSHIDHLKAIIRVLSKEDITIYLHAFMDGRDTPKTNGVKYLAEISKLIKVASIQGRSIGMDRDRRWEKIEKAYRCFTGEAGVETTDPLTYLKNQYEKDIYDEFIEPALFIEEGKITAADSVFFFNFRPDRAKQITLAFMDPDFKEFDRKVTPHYYLCMSPYVEEEVKLPLLFDKEKIKGGLCEHLASLGYKQFKIAETEKYAHVTYFFNGGEEKPFAGEERVLIPSPKAVATYDQKPEMSVFEVTDKLIQALRNKDYKLYISNFANCDMVGHTGNYEATIKAVEAVDQCVGEILKVCEAENITLVLTADHGNSDEMTYADGGPHTAHSKALVPFVLFHPKLKKQNIELTTKENSLKDIAPTILNILDLKAPDTFTGHSIFK